MRRYLLLPLLVLLLVPLSCSGACIPTGGAIGSIYEGKLRIDKVLRALREMGVRAVVSQESVHGLTLKRVEVILGDLAGRGGGRRVLHAYVYQGSSKSLVLAETDRDLSDSPLRLMELLLVASGLANLSKFSRPVGSRDNVVPPSALVRWLEEDRGVRIEQEVLRCSGTGSVDVLTRRRDQVAVLSNEVDRNLSLGVISDALSGVGLEAVWLDATDPRQVARLLEFPAAIVLGGPLSPGSGYVSGIYMLRDDARRLLLRLSQGRRGGIISRAHLPFRRTVLIIAGVDRNDTREAARAFASSDLPSKLRREVDSVESGSRDGERGVFQVRVRSSAACGAGTGRDVTVAVGYNEIFVRIREGAPNPCYRHRVEWYELDMDRRILRIVVGLEKGTEACIQCLGVVETEIRAGPLPEGEWTVIVDGIARRVTLGS